LPAGFGIKGERSVHDEDGRRKLFVFTDCKNHYGVGDASGFAIFSPF
jgi:hypothetical protein